MRQTTLMTLKGLLIGGLTALAVTASAATTATANTKPQLMTYITEWSAYVHGTYPAYPVDGSISVDANNPNPTVSNPDMVKKANKSNVLTFAFFQAWNSDLLGTYFPQNNPKWLGGLHIGDLWADLPGMTASKADATMWKNMCTADGSANTFVDGTCDSVQLNGDNPPVRVPVDYVANPWAGRGDNFGAFLRLKPSGNQPKKIISIGGANTLDNKSISTATFKAIFTSQATQTNFLNSLSHFTTAIQNLAKNDSRFTPLDGIDYDFEPPINTSTGATLAPDADGNTTAADYKNLLALVIATRQTLGKNAYISVTITANKDYLNAINNADSTWFATMAGKVDAINIMTYDLHGPWDPSSDPGAMSHIMLQQPSTLNPQNHYAINYATSDIVTLLKSFNVPADKIQVGFAGYGRGFAGVPSTSDPNTICDSTDKTCPGFDQTWNGNAATFPAQYVPAPQEGGLLPYKSVAGLLKSDPTYLAYNVVDKSGADGTTIASYIYSPNPAGSTSANGQMVGYMSPALVDSTCAYIKNNGLQGAIFWSMDTDAADDGSQGQSLISEYNTKCGQ